MFIALSIWKILYCAGFVASHRLHDQVRANDVTTLGYPSPVLVQRFIERRFFSSLEMRTGVSLGIKGSKFAVNRAFRSFGAQNKTRNRVFPPSAVPFLKAAFHAAQRPR